jgi:hypothetical protein
MHMIGTIVEKCSEAECTYFSDAVFALLYTYWPLQCIVILDTETGNKNVLLKG